MGGGGGGRGQGLTCFISNFTTGCSERFTVILRLMGGSHWGETEGSAPEQALYFISDILKGLSSEN